MRYLVHVWTEYAGDEDYFKVESDDIDSIYPLAEEKSYEHFVESGAYSNVVEENSDLDEADLEILIDDSYHYSIKEFTGTEEEWDEYEDL